jgi:hypothetical protein
VVNVGPGERLVNVAVSAAGPIEQRAAVGLPTFLRPRLINYSKTQSAETTLAVFMDEKEIARTNVSLKPGESLTRKILFTPREPGLHRGRFEISCRPSDDFLDDNSFSFVLNASARLSVLLVEGQHPPDGFEDEALYLKAALTQSDDRLQESATGLSSAGGREALAKDFLDVHLVSERDLGLKPLLDADVVILANCGGLIGSQFSRLREYVAGGGGLLIFPGDQVEPAAYNQRFFPVPGPQGERIMPATLGGALGEVDDPASVVKLGNLDLGHPALSMFAADANRYFQTVRFYRRFQLIEGIGSKNIRRLSDFSDDRPAILESHYRQGTILLAAFPAHPRWTNLPLKPEFVPFVLHLVQCLRRQSPLTVPSVVSGDETVRIGAPTEWRSLTGTVKTPSGRITKLSFERRTEGLVASFAETGERGFYTVAVTGKPMEDDSSSSLLSVARENAKEGDMAPGSAPSSFTELGFAVNTAPEESDQNILRDDDFRRMLPSANVTFLNASAEQEQVFGEVGSKQEVWRPLICVLFAVIGVEFLLATLGTTKFDKEGPRDRTSWSWIKPATWTGEAE